MIKLLCLSALAAAPMLAGADPIQTANSSSSFPRSYVDLAASGSGFDCAPAPIGAGTAPTFRSNDAGHLVWWYCATANGQWRVNWAAATSQQVSMRNLYAQFRDVLTADDRRAAFSAAVARNVTMPLNSPALLAVWSPFAAEMNAGKPTTLPVASATAPATGATLSALLAWAP